VLKKRAGPISEALKEMRIRYYISTFFIIISILAFKQNALQGVKKNQVLG